MTLQNKQEALYNLDGRDTVRFQVITEVVVISKAKLNLFDSNPNQTQIFLINQTYQYRLKN